MNEIKVTKEGARWVARFAFDYATKDVVKAAGFRFDGSSKLWWTSDPFIAAKLSSADPVNEAIEQSRAVSGTAAIPVPIGLAYLPYQTAGIAYAMQRTDVLIGDEMGLGKAQPLDAKLLTPTGWRTMGEAYVGMPIIGRDGGTYQVTGVFPQGSKPAYRVRMSDRSSTVCCPDHLWTVVGNRRTATRTLREMMERGFQYNYNPGHNKWQIPTMACAQFAPVELPIPAYILGVTVGSGERFIPPAYLLASPADRLALLRGLMDTDGSNIKNHVTFHTTSATLSKDVAELVRSLGGVAVVCEYDRSDEDKPTEWQVNVHMQECPFLLPYKAEEWRPASITGRKIVSAEYIGDVPQQCISVSAPDSLYVTDDHIVTHNTIQAIGLINANPSIKTVLVVCPASLKINWSRELVKWLVTPRTIAIANGSFPDAEIVVINYDILRKWRTAIDARSWDLLISDECHYLKNGKAQRTVAMLGHWERDPAKRVEPIKAARRAFLTGTPIVNRPMELWPLIRALDPFGLGKGGFMTFAQRYCDAKRVSIGFGRAPVWDFTGSSNLEELQQRMRAKFLVRRLKSEVLTELPAKRRQIVVVATNGAAAAVTAEVAVYDRQQALLRAAQAAVMAAQASGSRAAYEAAVRALQDTQRASFNAMSAVRHATAVAKIPHVVEHVTEMLEAIDKVVVFLHHHDVAHALRDAFPGCALVTGETPVGKRQLEVDRFQTDPACKVFVGGIQAAGVGLTLTAASHVVFAELDWTPAGVSQAEDRLHRIGQVNSVLVQHLVFDESIDARMAQVLIAKQEVIEAALDTPTAAVAAGAKLVAAADPIDDFAVAMTTIPDDQTIPF